MNTHQIRERVERVRHVTESLARELLGLETQGGLSPEARARLLKRLEEQRRELRTYARYLTEVEERDHKHLASRRQSPSETDLLARRTTLKQAVRSFRDRAESLRDELQGVIAVTPTFHAQTYFGLICYAIDQKTIASETQETLDRLAHLVTRVA